MFKFVLLFALLAVVTAFILPFKTTIRSGSSLKMAVDEKYRDPNGRMPGEAGYRPELREAPTDFAAYQAAEKAKKAAKAVEASKVDEKYRDANGKMPGDAGYRPELREAPADFAAYQAQLKAKKAAEAAAKN